LKKFNEFKQDISPLIWERKEKLMVLIFEILVGFGMLLFGRKLFWVFVAGVGFITAATWASRTFARESDLIILLIALVAGFIGALIAMFIRWLAIGLAGFLGGGYLVFSLLPFLGIDPGSSSWVFYVIGGVIGAILFAAFFDWTLIILSSLIGAVILTQSFTIPRPIGIISIVILIIVGIVVQARMLATEQTG
jgi:hypothetical protein